MRVQLQISRKEKEYEMDLLGFNVSHRTASFRSHCIINFCVLFIQSRVMGTFLLSIPILSPTPQCPHLPAHPISWAYKIRLNYWLPFTNSISVVKLRIPPHLNSGALILMSQSITKIVPEGEQMTFSSCISLR